jgi:general secretion pathway protein D
VVYARALLEELLQPRAEINLEMQFLEVSRNDMITYGMEFPTTFSLTPLTMIHNNVPSLLSGLAGFLAFGGGKTLIGIGIGNPTLVAQMSKSTGKRLMEMQLRSASGQKATFHIGERYPILTGGYGTTGAVGLQLGAPSFSFQDLGLQLAVTPVVNDVDTVSLDIEAAFKVLTGASVNGLPVISNREVKNTTRLKFGEWAIIGGLLTTNEARIISGLAGLAEIPYLWPLFGTHEHDQSTDQVLVLLRPVLLSLPASATVPHSFLTGTETRPLTPL